MMQIIPIEYPGLVIDGLSVDDLAKQWFAIWDCGGVEYRTIDPLTKTEIHNKCVVWRWGKDEDGLPCPLVEIGEISDHD